MIDDPELNWPEKYQKMENGNYACKCSHCQKYYIGPKRSHVCWKCKIESDEKWSKMTEEEKLAHRQECIRIMDEFFKNRLPK